MIVFARIRMVGPSGYPVATDRLGSIRYSGNAPMRFYPYGQEFTPTAANDQKKFGTYMRDSVSGLDYADQRYYGSILGRFMTPDPFAGSSRATDPGSWNRYAYRGRDPVNRNDPDGRTTCDENGDNCYDEITVGPSGFAPFLLGGGPGNDGYAGKPPFWQGFGSKSSFLRALNCLQTPHPGVSDNEVANNIKLAQAKVNEFHSCPKQELSKKQAPL